jgi:hypothetical protein
LPMVSYDQAVTVKGKGGREAWKKRPRDPRVTYLANLYASQRDWLKANGGAERLRAMIDRAMKAASKRG